MSDDKSEVGLRRINTISMSKIKMGYVAMDQQPCPLTTESCDSPRQRRHSLPQPTPRTGHRQCMPARLLLKPLPPTNYGNLLLDEMPPPRIGKPLDLTTLYNPRTKPATAPGGTNRGKVKVGSRISRVETAETTRKEGAKDGGTEQAKPRPKPRGGPQQREVDPGSQKVKGRGLRFQMSPAWGQPLPVSETYGPYARAPSNISSRSVEFLSKHSVQAYLRCNPEVLDEYMTQHVDTERLRSAILSKGVNYSPRTEPCKVCCFAQSDLRSLAERCHASCRKPAFLNIIQEMTKLVGLVLRANKTAVYLSRKYKDLQGLDYLAPGGGRRYHCAVGEGTNVVAECAHTLKPVVVRNLHEEDRFTEGAGPGSDLHIVSVLATPLILPLTGRLLAVTEVIRFRPTPPFQEGDLQLANAMLAWVLSNMTMSDVNTSLVSHIAIDEKLLDVSRMLFADLTSIVNVQQNIMRAVKKVLYGKRVSFFCVEEEENEIVQEYFDEGGWDPTLGIHKFVKKDPRHFPNNEGIVGKAVETESLVFCPNVKSEPRYSREIDGSPDVHVDNVVAIPIRARGARGVKAVVSVVNTSRDAEWMSTNDNVLTLLEEYSAIALVYCRSYCDLKLQQDQFKVTLEVLHYHIVCSTAEFERLRAAPTPMESEMPGDFNCYSFFVWQDSGIMLPRYFLYMMDKLFDLRSSSFDLDKLCRFVLTVRKNYRAVLYHNWMHGFTVCHSIYMMLITNQLVMTEFEAMALLVAAVCHDVDHRGYNNAFMQKFHMPLAALYTTSVMEQHHYKQTVLIMQTEGHDIFSFLCSTEYKQMLGAIGECILATDLAKYFDNQRVVNRLLEDHKLNIQNPEHRSRVKYMMMTAADLCSTCKPWLAHKHTVLSIYEEFYKQGDEEKSHGLIPLAIMDRDTKSEVPQQQIDFIKMVSLPLFSSLSRILLGTKPMLRGAERNLRRWTMIQEAQERTGRKSIIEDEMNLIEDNSTLTSG